MPRWLIILSALVPVSVLGAWLLEEKKMATKRKRRGLSGSPEHHAIEAKVLRIGAERRFNEAAEKSKKRACVAAFDRLIEAAEVGAQADLHDVEGRSFSLSREGIEAAAFAVGAFKANCIIPGGLSGLRRRKARR